MRGPRDPLAKPLLFMRKAGMRGGAICRLSGSCSALPTAMQVSFGEVTWLGKNTRRLMKPAENGAYSIERMRSVVETEGRAAVSRRAALGSTARCRSRGARLGGSALAADTAGGGCTEGAGIAGALG